MKINLLSQNEIKYLEPDQLVELLDILISAEINKHFTTKEIDKISIPRPITLKDGGEDAQVIIEIDPTKINNSQWIKNTYTTFQSKAQKMDDRECYNEVIADPKKRKHKELKSQVKLCFDNDGEYILFTIDSLTEISIKTRIIAIRKALTDCNISNPDTKKIKIYDANQIARWANDHIAAIIFVQKCRGISRPQSFFTWPEWHQLFLTEKKYEYQESEKLKENSLTLFNILDQEKTVRVVGHKGLGKTRFVLECFNPEDKAGNIKTLSDSLVYIDLAIAVPTDLVGFLTSHRFLEGILVVDNCSDDWHNTYSTLIKSGGSLKLITINDSPPNQSVNCIWLERKSQKETVKMIFKNCFIGLPDNQIDYFVNISEGFPEMVPFIENVLKDKSADIIFNTIPSEFINKFLFAGEKTPQEYELFKACSIFTEFSFFDENDQDLLRPDEQLTITKQNAFIHSKLTSIPVDSNAFYSFCKKYRDKRSLLEKRGFNYSVIPEPIAVNLAAEWWEEKRFDYIESLMPELNEHSLLIPMIDRLKTLDQSEKAKGMVAKAWGPKGPFATAGVLNTELGSRLFRSVVEVNPEITLNALNEAFEDYSLDELKTGLLDGRRNIVWALEKLVFRKETFELSARFLIKLAAAENENFGNNATAQFLQLFHIHLPGTEANYEERIKVIEWALNQPEKEIQEIGIHALGRGLKSHGFHRIIGAENQGFGTTLKEYSPETWDEVFNYWTILVSHLVTLVIEDSPFKNIAKDSIAENIRSLFYNSQSHLVKSAIEQIALVDKSLWKEAIESLKITKRYETLSDDESSLLENLIAILSPTNIEDRFRLIVSVPPWDYDISDINVDRNTQRLQEFAAELIATGLKIEDFVYLLVSGEQRQSFAFGNYLAENYEAIDDLVDEIIKQLSALSKNVQNPTILAGIIVALPREKQRNLINRIMTIDNLTHQAFYLCRMISPEKSDVDNLFQLVDEDKEHINQFISFQYGRPFDHMSMGDVVDICKKIALYGSEGIWTAFEIITQYCHENQEKWSFCRNFIRELISGDNILLSFNTGHRRDEYKWAFYTKKLLDNTNDTELAEIISTQILVASGESHFYSSDRFMIDLIRIFCQQYFDIFWRIISDAILTNGLQFFNLKSILGSHNGSNAVTGVLFEGNHQIIMDWYKEKGLTAAKRIAYMMPIFEEDHWHPIALNIINEFGNDEKVLSEIAANLGTYSMVGSSEKYYQTIIDLASQLLNHKLLQVRKWAKKCISYYQKAIRRDAMDEEQRK